MPDSVQWGDGMIQRKLPIWLCSVCVCVCVCVYTGRYGLPPPLGSLPPSSNYSSRGWSGLSLSLSLTHTLILSRARLFSVINSDDPSLTISVPLPHAALLGLLI